MDPQSDPNDRHPSGISIPTAKASSSGASPQRRPSGPSSPMEKVKVKLATWKWARENTADAEVEDTLPELRLPLLDANHSPLPLDPVSYTHL